MANEYSKALVFRQVQASQPVMSKASELAKEIEQQIRVGDLTAGDRLPAVRELAESRNLAPNTVASVYRTLADRGLVRGAGRKGTFVAGAPPIRRPVSDHVSAGLQDLATGNPDSRLLPDLTASLSMVGSHSAMYGAPQILPELSDWFVQWFENDEIPIGGIGLASGSLDGIERILAARTRPGDKVGVEDPGYASIFDLLRAARLQPVPLQIDSEGITPESLLDATSVGLDALIVTPRAHNPTGAAFTKQRAEELTAIVERHPSMLVIEDDHAAHVAGVDYFSVVSEATARWAVVRSAAKSLGPDLRVAGLVGDVTTIDRVMGRQALGAGWVSHILQRVVVGLVSAPEIDSMFSDVADQYQTRRQALTASLSEFGIEATGRSGLNVWIPVDDEATVVAGMQRHGYAIRAGARYRIVSEPGVRITTASSHPETLTAVAETLAGVLSAGGQTRSG